MVKRASYLSQNGMRNLKTIHMHDQTLLWQGQPPPVMTLLWCQDHNQPMNMPVF